MTENQAVLITWCAVIGDLFSNQLKAGSFAAVVNSLLWITASFATYPFSVTLWELSNACLTTSMLSSLCTQVALQFKATKFTSTSALYNRKRNSAGRDVKKKERKQKQTRRLCYRLLREPLKVHMWKQRVCSTQIPSLPGEDGLTLPDSEMVTGQGIWFPDDESKAQRQGALPFLVGTSQGTDEWVFIGFGWWLLFFWSMPRGAYLVLPKPNGHFSSFQLCVSCEQRGQPMKFTCSDLPTDQFASQHHFSQLKSNMNIWYSSLQSFSLASFPGPVNSHPITLVV